ncbi:hypothetical protein Taro_001041 [Colocasia esculenta]|uniref:Uncharacterized protein n=1 Tax=Colocasia esculenta TaxID=4460 RepID=A0A843T9V9_COLES|nr:hypothetical protein [Colocasia esculenta]
MHPRTHDSNIPRDDYFSAGPSSDAPWSVRVPFRVDPLEEQSLSPERPTWVLDCRTSHTEHALRLLNDWFSIVCLLLLALIDAHIVESRLAAAHTGNGRSLLAPIDCGSACDARCRLSSMPNLCKRACGTCCGRCNCGPPGTSGNEDVCPCYANMTTHGGKHKCP